MVASGGQYLITQRRVSAVLPTREITERLGVRISVGQMISFVSHPYEHYNVDLYLYECQLMTRDLTALGVQAFRWITSDEFDQLDFAPADEASMTQLLGEDERH